MANLALVLAQEWSELLPYRRDDTLNEGSLTEDQRSFFGALDRSTFPSIHSLQGPPGSGRTTAARAFLGERFKLHLKLLPGSGKFDRFHLRVPPASLRWVVVEGANGLPASCLSELDRFLRTFRKVEMVPFGGLGILLIEDGARGGGLREIGLSETVHRLSHNLRVDSDDPEFAHLQRSLLYDSRLSGEAAGWIDYNLLGRKLKGAPVATCTVARARHLNFKRAAERVANAAEVGEEPVGYLMVPSDYDPHLHEVDDAPHFPLCEGDTVLFKRTWKDCPLCVYPGQRGVVVSISSTKPQKAVQYTGGKTAVDLVPTLAKSSTDLVVQVGDARVIVPPVKSVSPVDEITKRHEWPITAAECLPVSWYRNQTVDRLIFDATDITSEHVDGLNLARVAFTRTASYVALVPLPCRRRKKLGTGLGLQAPNPGMLGYGLGLLSCPSLRRQPLRTGCFSVTGLDYGHDMLNRLMAKETS